jgi:predicted TIM-barrel fold metal-dependent hydrolase
MSSEKLKSYIKKHGLIDSLVFPFDQELETTNNKLVELLPQLNGAYGLVRYHFVNYMNNPESFLELLRKPKVIGAKLHPSFDRIPVSHPIFERVFKALQKERLIALIHTGRWQEVSHCSHAFQVAKRYPGLHVIVAHMGGNELANTLEAVRLAKKHPNTFLETSNCRLNLMIKKAVRAIGQKRVVFGTDVPWGSFFANLYTVLEAPVNEEQKKSILFDNLHNLIATVTS